MDQNNQPISPVGNDEQYEIKLTKKHIIGGAVVLIVIIVISIFGWWRGNIFGQKPPVSQANYQLNNDQDQQHYDSLQNGLEMLNDYPDSFEARVNIARERAYFRDYDEAIKMYQQANEVSPKNTLAWGNLAFLFFDLGRFDEAEACYLQAIKNKPTEVGFYIDLSQMYYEKMDKPQEAKDILLQGLSYDLNKKSGTLMSALANYYEIERNYSEALKWYQKMLEVNPDNDAVKGKVEELMAKNK